MDIQEVMKIPTMDAFFKLRDTLNLSDRQREIFFLKYSRRMRNIDIANELEPPVSQDTVGEDLKEIREKLSAVSREIIDKQENIWYT